MSFQVEALTECRLQVPGPPQGATLWDGGRQAEEKPGGCGHKQQRCDRGDESGRRPLPRILRSSALRLPTVHRTVGFQGASGTLEPACVSRLLDRIKRMKGVWWMPWRQEAMKDVALCDKPWGGESTL